MKVLKLIFLGLSFFSAEGFMRTGMMDPGFRMWKGI